MAAEPIWWLVAEGGADRVQGGRDRLANVGHCRAGTSDVPSGWAPGAGWLLKREVMEQSGCGFCAHGRQALQTRDSLALEINCMGVRPSRVRDTQRTQRQRAPKIQKIENMNI